MPRASDHRNPRPAVLFGLLLAALIGSAACLAIVHLRMDRTDSREFSFLRWNLVLAWFPVAIAVALSVAERLRAPLPLLVILGAGWIAFLPNAPYLASDLVHLGTTWVNVPIWFDAAMFGTFAVTGLLLGYISVFLVHSMVARRLGQATAWAVTLAAWALSSGGIYLGRVLRYNSWDAFIRPRAVITDFLEPIQHPASEPTAALLLATMAACLIAGYLFFFASIRAAERRLGRAVTSSRFPVPR
ncbi:MAG: DUF1361 domain-containing protein [Dehalococcoidia bacterium]|nr:DUF1361 domain-containing protein [Dehalococcoidia bacterium]